MKYFNAFTGINEDLIEKFIHFFNDNKDNPVTIIFNSRGGSSGICETMIYMINQMKDVTLIIHGVYSAAFEICYLSKAKKILSKSAKGMYHQPKTNVDMAIDGKPYYSEDKCVFENFKQDKLHSGKIARKVMTKKELSEYKKRNEVWFDFNRMKQIFPDAETMK